MNKKNIATAAVSLALVGVMAIGGTLAYLTDNSGPVTNKFVMDGLEITLKEDAVRPEGEVYLQKDKANKDAVYSDSAIVGTEVGVDYDKLLPGATVNKNPYLEVGASNAHAYVYAYVTGMYTMAPIEGSGVKTPAMWINGWSDGWTVVETDELSGTLLRQKVARDESTADDLLRLDVFDTVKVNSALTESQEIKDVTIGAFAHQADNVDEGVADAAAIAYFAKSAL